MDFKPKYTIKDETIFQNDRAKMGNLILEGMKTSGGTDIDWLIERNGNFVIMENKGFAGGDNIVIPWGQLIAFKKLHEKLNQSGKCYFYFFGYDEIDFKDEDSMIWYFEMQDFKDNNIEFEKVENKFLIKRQDMKSIMLKQYRDLMEKHWNEFGNQN
jgi:hypothetical protein